MTMEQYDALARSVTKEGFGSDQVYGAHYHTWRSAVQLFGILDGEHTVLDGNYDFLKPYYELVKQQEADGVCRSYIDTNASQLHYSGAFSEGNTATMNMGSWYITTLMSELANGNYDSELVGDWGIVKYPHPEGVEAGTTLGTITALAIPTCSEKQDAAWDFIKFACGEEGAEVVAFTGTFPAILNDSVVEQISSLEGFPQDENSKEALKTAQIYLEAPYDAHITEINTVLDTYHKDIMNGDTSIDDGIAKMNEEVGKILGE
ncbi:MAG: extracellular solute-binding protein [Marvinbryantia sp.]|uniref:extracellular solute-binding protein n=1 Tax=Marvinbryantia sp. TaxID=2496532 RepID=UPI00399B8B66